MEEQIIPDDIQAAADKLYPFNPMIDDWSVKWEKQAYIKGRMDDRATRDKALEAAWNASKTRESFKDWLTGYNELRAYYVNHEE